MKGYRNLDLEAFGYQQTAEGIESFRVRVAGSPAGGQKLADAEEVTVPEDLRKRSRWLSKGKLNLPEMIGLGENLAALLFPPRARSFLERSRERLEDDEGLRIRLRLDTYALTDLPWEYVYLPGPDTPADQKGAEGFLVLDRRVSLVRYEVMGQAPGSLDPVGDAPLRLVMLMANPDDPAYHELKLDVEWKHVEEALEPVPNIRAEPHPDATLQTLEDALTREVHVFHFAGHGRFEGSLGAAFGSQEGKGFIVLLDEERKAFRFAAEKLAQNLRGRGVRLAVLGACEAARRDQVNAWTGVAPALMRAGIPAVVGMQFKIQDANAIAFSRRFYRALAAGQPIDAAVTDGRLAIYNRGGEDERDWGVPVLYLHLNAGAEGVLFPGGAVAGRAAPPTPVGKYNIAVVRRLVDAALGDQELIDFCFDYFPAVYNQFTAGQAKSSRVRMLVEHAKRYERLGELLDRVQETNPSQYARFQSQLLDSSGP